jgi:hypothetical protein
MRGRWPEKLKGGDAASGVGRSHAAGKRREFMAIGLIVVLFLAS